MIDGQVEDVCRGYTTLLPFIQGTGASPLGALGLAPISTDTKEHIFGVPILAAVEFTRKDMLSADLSLL